VFSASCPLFRRIVICCCRRGLGDNDDGMCAERYEVEEERGERVWRSVVCRRCGSHQAVAPPDWNTKSTTHQTIPISSCFTDKDDKSS
jgi:hypothetical protein